MANAEEAEVFFIQEKNQTGLPVTDSGEKIPPENYVFALDIGTHDVIGIMGLPRGERLEVCVVEIVEHKKRTMIDGQIEDTEWVSRVAGPIKSRLRAQVGYPLKRIYVTAAGHALRTCEVHFELGLQSPQVITLEILCRLEAGAVQQTGQESSPPLEENSRSVFYLVRYSVSRCLLDNYPLANLLNHRSQQLTVNVITTFLPRETMDSLYSTIQKYGLEVASLTLEPIAAMNAAIPQDLRLLNLALIGIDARTSGIAVSKDGGAVSYTIATIAGDETAEALMREYPASFPTAEEIKMKLGQEEDVSFQDTLGPEQQVSMAGLREKIAPILQRLTEEISQQVLKANGEAPDTMFLMGGGSRLPGLCACVAGLLELPPARVTLDGRSFSTCPTKVDSSLATPELATPPGIAVSSALNLISDSFTILLNGTRAKLSRNNSLSMPDVLLIDGWQHSRMMGHSGKSLVFEPDRESKIIYGEHPTLAKIQLDGKDASPSDTVWAGDSILFESAQNGRDAALALGEMIDLYSPGTAFLGGEEIALSLRAMVSDQLGMPEQTIRARDRVHTRPISTLEQLLFFAGVPEGTPFLVDGDAIPPHTPLRSDDQIGPIKWEKSETSLPGETEPLPEEPQSVFTPAEPVKPQAIAMQPNLANLLAQGAVRLAQEKAPEPQVPNTAGLLPEPPQIRSAEHATEENPAPPQEQAPQSTTPPVPVILDRRAVQLDGRTDRSPYCLIDALNLVDVDLITPRGSIVLRVNGHETGYLEPLKDGGEVEIYWDGQIRNS